MKMTMNDTKEKRLIDANALCGFFQERYEYLRNASETPLPGGRVLVDTEIQCGAIIAKEFLDKAKDAPTVDAVGDEEIYKKAFEIAVRCARELSGTPELKEAYQEAQKDNRALKSFSDFCMEKAMEELNDCPNCGAKMDGGNYENP